SRLLDGATPIGLGSGLWSTNNSEVISILLDMEAFPNGTGFTVNAQHVKNSQQIKFLNARMTDDPTRPGVGPDLVYRDPWGMPYIISMDLNYDEKCRDAFYSHASVSQNGPNTSTSGFNGLFNSFDPAVQPNAFELNGGVMVWSLGPDQS